MAYAICGRCDARGVIKVGANGERRVEHPGGRFEAPKDYDPTGWVFWGRPGGEHCWCPQCAATIKRERERT